MKVNAISTANSYFKSLVVHWVFAFWDGYRVEVVDTNQLIWSWFEASMVVGQRQEMKSLLSKMTRERQDEGGPAHKALIK